MRLNFLISEFKKNWLVAIFGVVLLFFGSAILSVNEGRAFKHNRALQEALTEAVSFKDSNFHQPNGKSENYEGKLLHVHGELKVQEPVGDGTYNILVQAVKLRKLVQMYQWHEDYTDSKFDEGDESLRSYFYFKDWNSAVVDSRSFHSLSHQNPRQIPMQSKTLTAEKAFIGDFEISEAVKDLFIDWTDVTSDTRPEDTYIKMHLGWYYHVEDLFDPLIGDVRLKFQFAGLQGNVYTVVGKLVNGKIQPYKSNLKKEIILLRRGELSISDIFSDEHHSVRKKTWVVRAFGFTLIFFGVICTGSLLRVIFSSTILSFLAPDPVHQLKSNLRISAILAATVCVIRQSLHYLGIVE